MKIFLLTHARELHRATNTGALAIANSNSIVKRILWERVNPNKDLTRLIANNEAILLYSKGELSSDVAVVMPSSLTSIEPLASALLPRPVKIEEYENIIIIDGTWQEAKKIFNQSPYLKNAPQFTLEATNDSLYKLRANQPKGGLCTIECIIEVLKLKGQDEMAAALLLKFIQFNS